MKKENIFDDAQLEEILKLQEELRIMHDMFSSVAAEKILSLAEGRNENRIKELFDIYKKLNSFLAKHRDLMLMTLQDQTSHLFDGEQFDPVSVKTEDLQWFVTNIQIAEKQNVLRISIPLLMPNRKGTYSDRYIDTLIWLGLMEYTKHGEKKLDFGKNVMIAFCHIYDKNRMHVKDHDNIEVKNCIDRIAEYLIVSDRGLNCQLFHKSMMGNKCGTDIYIMSEKTAEKHLYDIFSWNFDL